MKILLPSGIWTPICKVCYAFPLRSAFWHKWYRGITLGLVGILETATDLKQHLYLNVSSSNGTWCHAWCLVIHVAHRCEIWCNVRIGTVDIWISRTHLHCLLTAATSGISLRQKQATTASLLCWCCDRDSFSRTGPNYPHVTVLSFMVPY